MPTLSLLRHAKAAHPLAHQSDFDRPLTERGRADAARLSERLNELDIDLAMVSTAQRTSETWKIARSQLRQQPVLTLDPGLYLCPASSLIARLRDISGRFGHVVVVGHNPGVHEAALWLAGSTPPSLARTELERKFPTASMAVFDLGDTPWAALAPETARLVLFVTPAVSIAGS